MCVLKFRSITYLAVCALGIWASNLVAATTTEGYSAKPIHAVKTQQKIVALTFDDGPSKPYTDQILNILDRHNVKATFFVVGMNIKRYPDMIQKIMKKGHDIGNHSMYHDKLNKLPVEKITKDIAGVDKLLRAQGYDKEIFFRAPYGLLSQNLESALAQLHKRHVLFDFLPKDWENPAPQVIHDRVLQRAKPGFIITLHDGWDHRENTVKATEMIIQSLQAKGYRFVTATELLNAK